MSVQMMRDDLRKKIIKSYHSQIGKDAFEFSKRLGTTPGNVWTVINDRGRQVPLETLIEYATRLGYHVDLNINNPESPISMFA